MKLTKILINLKQMVQNQSMQNLNSIKYIFIKIQSSIFMFKHGLNRGVSFRNFFFAINGKSGDKKSKEDYFKLILMHFYYIKLIYGKDIR